ncbi:MAG TPA: hypothetical protein VGP48_08835 [Stellaceae bacterium]|jgi:hypothetical protein|nr:hypothetical protein [Stellaceae bacterium]
MSRLFLVILAISLSSCAPAHYGYAPNLRPTLAQLSAESDDSDNPFRANVQTAAAGDAQ